MAPTVPYGYCFPDISRNRSERSQRPESTPSFRRLAPGSCAGTGRPAAEIGAGGIEDVEQNAYCRGLADGEKIGFEQGEQAGAAAAQGQVASALQSLKRALTELQGLHRQACRDLEKEIVDLALEVARKIVGRAVEADPSVVAGMVRESLSRVEHAGSITIRMNPGDLDRLAGSASQMVDELAEPGRVHVEADASVTSGGCFLSTECGEIDARLEHRFEIVADAFQEEWAKEAGQDG